MRSRAYTIAGLVLALGAASLGLKLAYANEGVDKAPATKADFEKPVHNPAPVDVPGEGNIAAGAKSSSAVERGRYIAVAGDCVACHSIPGGDKPFAGGYKLDTPFGTLLSSNITQDKQTGIGDWTEQQFADALRKGKGRDGENLYPAMPYTAYAKMTDADVADLYAYIKTIAPVSHAVDTNQLPFPFNIRLFLSGWNLMFFDSKPLASSANQSAQWQRGQYVVEALEHCAACHTPKNFLGGDKSGQAFQGAELQGWFAPDITNNPVTGIGTWSDAQVVEYLRKGNNAFAVASGPMAEAVTNSTQHLSDADLRAMVVYLKQQGRTEPEKRQALAMTDPRMQSGEKIFATNCEACHTREGEGVSNMIAGFAGRPSIASPHADSLLNSVLMGSRGAVTAQSPTGAGMPAFDWKLSDPQIANVLTYIRNQWGNAAEPVTPDAVKATRASLGAKAQLSVAE